MSGEVAHIKIDNKSGKHLSFPNLPPDAWLFTCYPDVQSYMQAGCDTADACLPIEEEDAEYDVQGVNDQVQLENCIDMYIYCNFHGRDMDFLLVQYIP